jgi:Fur family iron response transcriptional regulator
MSLALQQKLRSKGVRPSAHRLAVADYVLSTTEHPSAEQVLERVRIRFPLLSRATVYNTLNLFVEKGLLRELVLAEGKVVFDPKLDRHHHFVDDETGQIEDVPWSALSVGDPAGIDGYDVREYSVVLRGKKRGRGSRSRSAHLTNTSKEE